MFLHPGFAEARNVGGLSLGFVCLAQRLRAERGVYGSESFPAEHFSLSASPTVDVVQRSGLEGRETVEGGDRASVGFGEAALGEAKSAEDGDQVFWMAYPLSQPYLSGEISAEGETESACQCRKQPSEEKEKTKESGSTKAEAEAKTPSTRPLRILVVEDTLSVSKMLKVCTAHA